MATEVTVYEAGNGKRFDTREEAEFEDDVCGLENLLADPSTDLWFKGTAARDTALWLLRNYALIPRKLVPNRTAELELIRELRQGT